VAYNRLGYRVQQALCLGNIGILLYRLNRLDEAADVLERGIAIVEELRGNLSSIDVRSSFVSNKFYLYENLISILVEKDEVADAFAYAERAKARSFLDMLGNKAIGSEKTRTPETAELIDEERSLQSRISAVVEIPDSGDVLVRLLRRHQNVLEKLQRLDPEYASVKSIEPVSVADLQELLDDSTALVEYFLGDAESFVFVVRKDGIRARKLKLGADFSLDVRVEKLRRKLYSEFPNKKTASLRESRLQKQLSPEDAVAAWQGTVTDPSWQYDLMTMYAKVFAPADSFLTGITQLFIVPHGPLHHLPFQALVRIGSIDKRPDRHIVRPRYLIEDYAIAYLPSASVLKFARQKRRGEVRNGLIIGDPTYADPVYKKKQLEGALIEADSVAAYLPEPTVLKRELAEESVVKSSIGHEALIHFATHGELNKKDPLKSRILLAAAKPQGSDDGNLTVAEVFNLDLNSSLVTLSACQTAQVAGEEGKFTPGDDLVGLTRSFMYAGTPSVVASLWYVDDAATLAWMRYFYSAWLRSGASKIRAAQQAALRMLSKPEDADWIFPFYWGAFIFFGDFR
jgi:CHAT domain-containing protein